MVATLLRMVRNIARKTVMVCARIAHAQIADFIVFEHDRAAVPSDVLALAPTLPEFLTGYGWSLRPFTLLNWYSLLDRIQVLD